MAGKVNPGTHMHITPWSYPQLYVFLKLAGFHSPTLISEPLSQAKHIHEHIVGLPAKLYCRRRLKKAKSDEEREYWNQAGTQESIFGRHLIIATTKATLS